MKAWQRLSAYICLLAMFQNIFLQVAFASGHEDSAFASSNTNLISTTEPVTFSTPDSFATNTSVSDESLEALEMGIISNSNFPPAKSDASTDSPHTSSSSGSPHYLPKQDIGSDYAALDSDEESTQEKSFCRTLTFPDDIPPRQAKLSWQQLDGFPTSLVVSPLHLRWLNGQGELLERKLHRTMGAEGFRQGFEFMVERLFQIGLTGLVMAQLSSANNFTDIFNVFTNGDKHALTALAYNVNQNEKFRRGFIGLATLPLWWGGVKAVRAAWTITKDPQEELKMALADLSSREATSTGFWDDTARWLLPLPPQGRYLNNLMRILRWDGRLDEAERRQGFEAVVNFFNNHGGYSRIASGFALAQLAVSGKKSGQASGRIGEGIGQETYEEIIAINPFEAEVIALIQGMATRSFQQRTPHNLAHQIYGRYLLWWLGRSDYISDSKKESAAFWTFKIGKLAVKALLLQKITEAIQAFLNCPQREGVSFTDAKLGPIKPTRKCFERYQEEFFKLPGQSPKILLDLIPTFNLGTDPIFIDLAGKGIDTENLTAYLQGLLNHYRVGRFPKITGLDISGGSLGASDFVDPTNTINFAKVLRQFTDLEHLNLADNRLGINNGIDVSGSLAALKAFGSMKKLQCLDLSGNQLGGGHNQAADSVIKSLADALDGLPLTYLNLGMWSIGSHPNSPSMVNLGQVIGCLAPTLKELRLQNTYLGKWDNYNSQPTRAIAAGIGQLYNLETLAMGPWLGYRDDVASEGTEAIGRAIGNLTKLRNLDLHNIGLGVYGMYNSTGTVAIIDGLPKILEQLNLSGSGLGLMINSTSPLTV